MLGQQRLTAVENGEWSHHCYGGESTYPGVMITVETAPLSINLLQKALVTFLGDTYVTIKFRKENRMPNEFSVNEKAIGYLTKWETKLRLGSLR